MYIKLFILIIFFIIFILFIYYLFTSNHTKNDIDNNRYITFDEFHNFMNFILEKKNNDKEFNKMTIKEIEAYPITIELSKSTLDLKIKYAKDYINKKIESFDNIKNRIPINQDGPNSLTFYF